MTVMNLLPPDIPLAVIEDFTARHYGLSGSWTRLAGERDQNFRLVTATSETWTIKICNPGEPSDIVACQALALEHIARTDPGLPVPRLRRTLDGDLMPVLALPAGNAHPVLLLSYLEGEVIGERRLSPAQLASLGAIVARLGRALRGFVNPAPAARALIWDTRLAPRLLSEIGVLPPSHQPLVRVVLENARDNTLPRLEALRSQIIHGDVHPYNALVDGSGGISGIIDFGDMVHAPLIQDLANLVGDMLEHGGDMQGTIDPLVAGYCNVTRLEEAEVDLLLDLAEVRLAITPLITTLRSRQTAAPLSYLSDFSERALSLLGRLRGETRPFLNALARRAASFPPQDRPRIPLDELLARRHKVLGKKLQLFYEPPVNMVRGEGVWLTDSSGRRYLDCYNNVPHVGHCHPYVAEAIARQVRILNTNTRYVSEEAVAYAERLAATVHPSLSAVLYVNSGSEANDVAWRLAKAWTGNRGGLCMEFAYHGITDATDSFSPSNAPDVELSIHMRAVPPPDDYRGPYRRGEPALASRYAALVDGPIRSLKEAGLGIAAIMIDSAFMTNGMLDVPPGYLKSVCDRVRAAGGLFIADEVQSGFGRMGTAMWGHQHHGVVPDFVTIGKPAGNGHPVGAVLTRPEILEYFTRSRAFFSTFGGNNVSCAAGLAVLDVIRDENLVENSRLVGKYLKDGLLSLRTRHSLIGDESSLSAISRHRNQLRQRCRAS
jgi:4-aminobutyrate aminotransferase-like enzyme